ncbi:hypothetical protein, partial [Kaarinaea lacus]
LGAGGAARGVLLPLLDEKPACLVIANRTASKAEELVEQFKAQRNTDEKLSGTGFDELKKLQFDIVINATSASLEGNLPAIPADCITNASIVYDMMYGKNPTPFLMWAKKMGAQQISDGLGMLVEQAAESFFIWRNVKPDTKDVIKKIRDKINTED